eukprot:CAMPEP_0119303636 /NCGR_PEP_ID=MMETSP1333-20130426/5036_1 /TAXON_ID=418940 /ORGANISM="Scyphosphaera apsteinii, Strain RCC1455" /LENGTH=617 /DNA_ID=CAMNT_0007306367 /DNA_START=214 /DNA_END=2064 /DNA_ORIENTATION=-
MGATVVLPWLNLNGKQSGPDYKELSSMQAPFTAFFDFAATKKALLPYVDVVLNESSQDLSPIFLDLGPITQVQGRAYTKEWYEQLLEERYPTWHAKTHSLSVPQVVPRLRFGCTLMSLSKSSRLSSGYLMQKLHWLIDAALVPAAEIQESAKATVSKMQELSHALGGGGHFSALHLRVEDDWLEHCKQWESSTSTPPRDNCMTNTDSLSRVFAIEAVNKRHPLFVAMELELNVKLSNVRGLRNLKDYQLESRTTMAPQHTKAPRELAAFHDLLVCSMSHRFIGNSVSTFSAYLELQRRHRSQEAAAKDFHYNGGKIPLEDVIFKPGALQQAETRSKALKWIFTVNGDASPTFFELTQVAVSSALRNTQLIPICVHLGQVGRLADWLQQAGVRVIQHKPSWQHFIARAAKHSQKHQNMSTNYINPRMMLSTLTRLDIPVLGFVDEYILYADVDVLFLAPLSLTDFLPAPAFYAVGSDEMDDEQGNTLGLAFGNAGVMLMNVEALRRTHDEFIAWTFQDKHVKNALHFAEYGPLDQGAFNAFYQGRFDVHHWPFFNWKPYWGYSARAKIVHFHGPKPREYLAHRMHKEGHLEGLDNPTMSGFFRSCDEKPECYNYMHMW